jgi:hypothetical protein
MALTYRGQKGSALTIQELDDNFAYFTGSHAVTGSLIVTGSHIVTGSLAVTGSLTVTGSTNLQATTIQGAFTVSGSLATFNYASGALLTPTGSFTTPTPTFAASEGQFLFGSGSAGYSLFAYIGGAWRSSSLF